MQATLERTTAPKTFTYAATRTKLAWWMLFLAGLGFVIGGAYAVYRGLGAKEDVKAALSQEHIITAEDAELPNVPVTDHATAHAQADVIQKHILEATGGKTYAELARDDPNRELAFRGTMLRSSLLSAALAWHVADLATGLGVFIVSVGLLIVAAVILTRPAFFPRTE